MAIEDQLASRLISSHSLNNMNTTSLAGGENYKLIHKLIDKLHWKFGREVLFCITVLPGREYFSVGYYKSQNITIQVFDSC